MTPVFDFLGMLVSLLATYFFIRRNPQAWTLGMMASLLNAYLYFSRGIYADTVLEMVYFSTSVYGWYCWKKQWTKQQNPISILSLRHTLGLILSSAVLYEILLHALTHYTDSTIPKLDAFTTVLSLIGQWLMAQKIILTWIVWFIVDAIYAYLYWQKAIPFHVVLMGVYLIMAVIGYFTWLKQGKSPLKSQAFLPQ